MIKPELPKQAIGYTAINQDVPITWTWGIKGLATLSEVAGELRSMANALEEMEAEEGCELTAPVKNIYLSGAGSIVSEAVLVLS